jgi:hypothetical protein
MSGQSTNLNELRSNTVSKTKEWVNQQLVQETNRIYEDQLNREFDDSQRIMNQDEIIRFTNIQEQELNTKIIIIVASLWMVILSACLLVMFYMKAIQTKHALIGLIGIWVIGFIYLGWYIYQHTQDPSAHEFVNDAQNYSKAFLRATLPDAIIGKCPQRCQINYDQMNKGVDKNTRNGISVFSDYPMDYDYWKGGIPSPEPGPKDQSLGIRMEPGAIVDPIEPPLQTFVCVNKKNPSTEITSAQPCHVYPGFTDKNDMENLSTLRWGMNQTGFPRKN